MHAMLGTPSTCKSKIGNGCREKDFLMVFYELHNCSLTIIVK